MRTRYGILLLPALMLSVAVFISPAHALTASIYTRTDRASYLPGESGTLTITIRNDGDRAFTLISITIEFRWKTFLNGQWEGNQTIDNINVGIPSVGIDYYVRDIGFTVPSDGRASTGGTGCSCVTIQTDDGSDSQGFLIVVAIPAYQTGPVGSVLPYLEIILQVATVLLLFLVFVSLRRIPK